MKESTRKRVVWLMIGGFVAMIAIPVMLRLTRRPPPELVAADRAPLVEDGVAGQRRLRHPTLGFSMLHPGPEFAEAPEIVAKLHKPGDQSQYYAYADSPVTEALAIAVAGDEIDSRDQLAKELTAFENSFRGAAEVSSHATMSVVDDGVQWEGRRQAHFHLLVGGAHYRGLLVPMSPTGHDPILVALIVISQDPDALAGVLASFDLGP
jgi:hypothetical protein